MFSFFFSPSTSSGNNSKTILKDLYDSKKKKFLKKIFIKIIQAVFFDTRAQKKKENILRFRKK